eukprot:5128332-Pleurochrysis_carterae.AAC.1
MVWIAGGGAVQIGASHERHRQYLHDYDIMAKFQVFIYAFLFVGLQGPYTHAAAAVPPPHAHAAAAPTPDAHAAAVPPPHDHAVAAPPPH